MANKKKHQANNTPSSESSRIKKDFTTDQSAFLYNHTIHYTLFFVLTFCLYGWTYVFDYGFSDQYVLNALNNLDTTFDGFLHIFKQTYAGTDYRPVTVLSFWLEKLLFRHANPHISHLANVLLMAVILIKLYDLIILSKFYDNEKKLRILAILAALFFLIHPNHVSVVANIKSRDNLLSMLFGLLACRQVILIVDLKQYIRIVYAVLYFLLASFSKLDSSAFIVIAVLILVFFRKYDIKTFIKYAVIIFIILLFASAFRNLFLMLPEQDLNAVHVQFDKNPIVGNDTFINRISLSLTSLYYYLKFLFIPWGYHFIFGYNQIPINGIFSIENCITLIAMTAFFILSVLQYKKNKLYLFSLLFYIFSIAFALNLLTTIVGIVTDRHNFIPSVAFCLALSALLIDTYNANSLAVFKRPVLLILVLVFTFFTISRTKNWKNNFTLIEHDLPYLTESVNAYRVAAATYCNEALSEEMKPGYDRNHTDQLIKTAEQYAIKGLEIYEPVVELWEIRGLCSFYKQDFPSALHYFLKCRDVDSSYLGAINYIGFTYWKLNNTDSAAYYFNHVMKREHFFGYSANNMVDMLIANNKKHEADSLLNELKKRYPEDKWLNRKMLEVNQGKYY